MRQRVERARREQADGTNSAVMAAVKRMERERELEEFKGRMVFELNLTADAIVRRLERLMKDHAPNEPDEAFSGEFMTAVRLLPFAKMFREECEINCIKE